MVQLRQCTIVLHERQCVPNAPINGMPHLAYLGQILEKGGCQNLPREVGT